MTTSAANSGGIGRLFDSTFSIVSTVVSAALIVIALMMLWTGYQDSTLPVVGTELSILTGVVGFMLAMFFGIGALIVAAFMEPGFDH